MVLGRVWRRSPPDSTGGPFRDELLGARAPRRSRAHARGPLHDRSPRARAEHPSAVRKQRAFPRRTPTRRSRATCGPGGSSRRPRSGCSTTSTSCRSQIAEVRRNLPWAYYRQLPALASREHLGRARVYAMAIELVRHSDGRFERKQLEVFLNSYQRVAPLTHRRVMGVAQHADAGAGRESPPPGRGNPALASGAADRGRATSCAPSRTGPTAWPADMHVASVVQLLLRTREYGSKVPAAARCDPGAPRRPADHRRRRGPPRAPAPGRHASVGRQRDHQPPRSARRSTGVTTSKASAWWNAPCGAIRPVSTAAWTSSVATSNATRSSKSPIPAGEAQLQLALKAVECARRRRREGVGVGPGGARRLSPRRSGPGDLEAEVAYRPPLRARLRRLALRHPTPIYLGIDRDRASRPCSRPSPSGCIRRTRAFRRSVVALALLGRAGPGHRRRVRPAADRVGRRPSAPASARFHRRRARRRAHDGRRPHAPGQPRGRDRAARAPGDPRATAIWTRASTSPSSATSSTRRPPTRTTTARSCRPRARGSWT